MPEQTRPAGPKAQNADYVDGIDSSAFELISRKDVASGYAGLGSDKTLNTFNLARQALTGATTLTATSPNVNDCSASGGAFAVTLPAANAQAGKTFFITKTDSGSNAVTISRAGSDTIAGATSILLSQQYQFVQLVSDGTSTWMIRGQGVASTNGALKVPTLSGDPASPVDGEAWVISGSSAFRYRANAITREVEIVTRKDTAGGYLGLNASKCISAGSLNVAPASRTGAVTLTTSSAEWNFCSASGGAFAVTLPTASSQSGKLFIIKKTDSSGNAVTVTRAGSDTIDGATTYALTAQYQSVTIISDGTNWNVV